MADVLPSAAQQAKIAPKLLQAVQADLEVEADVMVQLESPEAVMQRVCGTDSDSGATLSRAQKTTCMVNNMQQFADDSQQEVKDLLAQHEGEYSDAMFFWINNSVAVKKAKGKLVLALSVLDTVLKIRPEQIFHTMGGGGGNHRAKVHGAKAADEEEATTFGLGVMHG